MRVRYVELCDKEEILELERAANAQFDLDFDRIVYNEWALDEKDFLELVRQRPTDGGGPAGGGNGPAGYMNTICVVETEEYDLLGAFSYEQCPVSYELTWMVLTQELSADEIVPAIGNYLARKARRSSDRKTVNIYLRDREEAGLSHILPAWTAWLREAELEYTLKLLPDYYPPGDGSCDGWRLSFTQPSYRSKADLCEV